MSVNPTYKNLEAKLRIVGLTIGQWVQLACSVGFAVVFVEYLSPLPIEPTISLAVLVAGLPVATSYALLGAEFSATRLMRLIWRWRRRPQRYQAGPGASIAGYAIEAPAEIAEPTSNGHAPITELELLWDD